MASKWHTKRQRDKPYLRGRQGGPHTTDDRYGHSYPPPPPPPQLQGNGDHYRPRSPPRGPPPNMYEFRGQAPREANGHTQGFDFNMPGPRFELQSRPGDEDRIRRSPLRGPKRDTMDKNRRDPNRDRQGFRGGFQKRGPSTRVILRSQREATPDRLAGMDGATASFAALVDLSDSEAEMKMSDDDAGSARPAKRVRSQVGALDHELPKWSNPDPYTSLPPPDESQVKKKDVVQLIRKAKIKGEASQPSQSDAAANADFISFDVDASSDGYSPAYDLAKDPIAEPRHVGKQGTQFKHLDNLHPDRGQPKPRSLAERIEQPHSGGNGGPSFRMPPAGQQGSHHLPAKPDWVAVNAWPPPDVQAAVAGSKRRLDLDDGGDPARAPSPPDGKKRKRPPKPPTAFGAVQDDWLPNPGVTSTPWCKHNVSGVRSMKCRLHEELRDFYDWVRPYDFERQFRERIIDRIERALQKNHRGGQLHTFGSFASGIHLPTGDLDLVFISPSFQRGGPPEYCRAKKWMYKALGDLYFAQAVAKPGVAIFHARVPILKVRCPQSNIEVDISFENNTGLIANKTVRDWKAQYPALPLLVSVIKQFLSMRKINEVHTGGIGGFAVICLIVSRLQHYECHDPEERLAMHLLDFFEFYGNFHYQSTGITIEPPGYFTKGLDAKLDRLCVIDPNNPDNDLTGGSAKIDVVFQTFRAAAQALRGRMAALEKLSFSETSGRSILEVILGGNYQVYDEMREKLQRLTDR